MNDDLIRRGELAEEVKSITVYVNGLRAGKGVLQEYAKHYRDSLLRIIDEQPAVDAVSIEEYETMKEDRDSWKDAFAEYNEKAVSVPCKVGSIVFAVGDMQIQECEVVGFMIGRKEVSAWLSFVCDHDCEGCPFNSWHQEFSGEYSCEGEWGEAVMDASCFGKDVFLNRKDAEQELQKRRTNNGEIQKETR